MSDGITQHFLIVKISLCAVLRGGCTEADPGISQITLASDPPLQHNVSTLMHSLRLNM